MCQKRMFMTRRWFRLSAFTFFTWVFSVAFVYAQNNSHPLQFPDLEPIPGLIEIKLVPGAGISDPELSELFDEQGVTETAPTFFGAEIPDLTRIYTLKVDEYESIDMDTAAVIR